MQLSHASWTTHKWTGIQFHVSFLFLIQNYFSQHPLIRNWLDFSNITCSKYFIMPKILNPILSKSKKM